ncbi:DUF167 family protein [uncultured Thalassospira sp.]|jgi:uncharacterized protein (TIGR00251 family)|uniref:DUF167 domain-containing protein n=1 Tax=uncultured Thalassospira sp. TaxID=404382 RepID=UPI0030DBC256|tara:strand:+ start:5320 stop:5652 length:333 start_codon:yes stop_codon:yes gene_type:complete
MAKPACDILPDGKGVRLCLRLTPKASRNSVGGAQEDADGQNRLKATVTTVPENGKANDALVKLLAKTAKWPKSAITIVSGHTDRNKVLTISGDTVQIVAQINQWTGEDLK